MRNLARYTRVQQSKRKRLDGRKEKRERNKKMRREREKREIGKMRREIDVR